MASNIGTLASFATQSMKPSPGEEADAIWAQKLADNTGFLYHKPIRLDSNSAAVFTKAASHNALRGISQGSNSSSAAADVMRVFAQGQIVGRNQTHTLVGTMAYTRTVGSYHVYNFDISSLTNGSRYSAWYDPTTGNAGASSFELVWGTGAPD